MNIKFTLRLFALTVLFALGTTVQAETASERSARMAWWRDARFGMFIHWGPVALTGQEISWSRANSNTNSPNNGPTPVEVYDHLYQKFDPTNFNANEWVSIAHSAGMKYMVLTAKHGDGFLLWDSKVDGYNIAATPFHRDVCKELADAAHDQKMKLGWYFSPMDWRDPDCRSENNDRFVKKIQAELRELLSNYGKISVLWFDSDGRPTMWDPTNTYALVKHLQPQIIINNRLEMSTWEQWVHQGGLASNEDYYTPEQRIGAYDDQKPWETCMTLGTQWSWKPDDKIKSTSEVIHVLADCVGGDGNLLLDVGPMPDGRIEPRQVEILREVGAWLDQNGRSIYGTRGGPWKPNQAIASTRRGKAIYVHVLNARENTIELPDIARKIKSAEILGGGKIRFTQANGLLTLTVPLEVRNANDTVVQLNLESSAMNLPAQEIPPIFHAFASNVFENNTNEYGPQKAFDNESSSRWATDNNTKQAWLTVNFVKPQAVGGVHISEAYANRVQKFEFQIRDGSDWKTIFSGTTIGDDFQKSFPPVIANEFRLNILDATEGPTINEVELLP